MTLIEMLNSKAYTQILNKSTNIKAGSVNKNNPA